MDRALHLFPLLEARYNLQTLQKSEISHKQKTNPITGTAVSDGSTKVAYRQPHSGCTSISESASYE